MALTDFTLLSGADASAVVQLIPVTNAGVPTLADEVRITTTISGQEGLTNVKTSTLTGTVAAQNLVLACEAQVTEENVVTKMRELVNPTAIEIVDNKFEDGQNLKTTKGYVSLTKCVVIHYLPVNQDGKILITAFIAAIDDSSGEITTTEGENNNIKFNAVGTYAPAEVTIDGATLMANLVPAVTSVNDIVIANGSYGTETWVTAS